MTKAVVNQQGKGLSNGAAADSELLLKYTFGRKSLTYRQYTTRDGFLELLRDLAKTWSAGPNFFVYVPHPKTSVQQKYKNAK